MARFWPHSAPPRDSEVKACLFFKLFCRRCEGGRGKRSSKETQVTALCRRDRLTTAERRALVDFIRRRVQSTLPQEFIKINRCLWENSYPLFEAS